MSFHIRPHLERARRLITEQGDDPASLVYAALELRLGIERVSYEMLKLRLGYLSVAELQGWQPRKVLEALEELADPLIAQSATVSFSEEDASEPPRTWHRLAERKAISPKQLGRWWNKLGNFLHVQVPKSRTQPLSSYPEVSRLRAIILRMIDELEPFSHGADFHFAPRTTFECTCGFTVQRTTSTLKEDGIVVCINPDCGKEWRVRFNDGGDVGFEANSIELHCQACNGKHFFPEKIFRELHPGCRVDFDCQCGKRNQVRCGFGFIDEE